MPNLSSEMNMNVVRNNGCFFLFFQHIPAVV